MDKESSKPPQESTVKVESTETASMAKVEL